MNGPWTRIYTLALSFALAITTAACQERSSGATSPNPALQSFVESKSLESVIDGPQMTAAERTRLADQVRRFYKAQAYQLVWIDGEHPSKHYQELVKVLGTANEHGLPPELYPAPIEQTDGKSMAIPTERAPELDAKATASFFRYFLHLTGGRLDPHALQSLWTLRPQ
jgi:hypothetical protein